MDIDNDGGVGTCDELCEMFLFFSISASLLSCSVWCVKNANMYAYDDNDGK